MLLRDVLPEDLPIFFEQQRDPASNAMAAFPAREWEPFLTHWRERVLGNANTRKQTITDGGAVVGNVVSWEGDGRRFVGYWIGREFWGRGIASAALAAFLEGETTRPLWADVAPHNLGSMRVLEKCGFQEVGDITTGSHGVDEHFFRLD